MPPSLKGQQKHNYIRQPHTTVTSQNTLSLVNMETNKLQNRKPA